MLNRSTFASRMFLPLYGFPISNSAITVFIEHCSSIAEPVLKSTSIKRPPFHNDHSQVRPSIIWWYLHCIERPHV